MTISTANTPKKDVILMTSAIASPAAYLVITNHEERLLQTLCGLVRWIRDTSANTIVLCDGTSPTFDFSKVQAFAKRYGKTLEILIFQESDNFLVHGKGYAEGEVIEYALTHSAHLGAGTNFYKVTGRTYVANFDEIRLEHENDDAVFFSPAWKLMPSSAGKHGHANLSARLHRLTWSKLIHIARQKMGSMRFFLWNLFVHGIWSPRDDHTVWTQFYKCDSDFFRKNLLKAYENVNDFYNSIEHAYYARLRATSFTPMSVRPRIVGLNGGFGSMYDENYNEEDIRLAESLK